MARFFAYILGVGALVVGAVWLADRPGSVTVLWEGWRIDTSVPVLLLLLALLVGVLTAVARLLLLLRRAPRRFAEARRNRHSRRGYLALADGFAAVAAGDGGRALKLAREAEARLQDPSLTRLLTAQAADLAGDTAFARGSYDALREQPETELVGLRGLIGQARKEGKRGEALELARRAVSLRPDSAWAVQALFEEQTQAGLWAEAEATLNHNPRSGAFTPARERHLRGVLAAERAAQAHEDGDRAGALKLARQALEHQPDLIPAAVLAVRLFTAEGKERKAAAVVEEAWRQAPHPELAQACFGIWPEDGVLRRAQRAERLAAFNPDHPESRLTVAEAFLEAGLWGQARSQLEPLAHDGASGRVAMLMARLEQSGNGDAEAATEWLRRAGSAPASSAWRCSSCLGEVGKWSVRCPNCGAFDTVSWSAPTRALVSLAEPMAGERDAGG
ncbi:MAG: heme biosynthesis protein HemY [Alphaproteobacteria bacterium]|nr:heme biosynthesis protein HemY [Alphaproteobacteria bacterium]MBF0130201.1 heme biosynthesis protein HemY [Alphaproteobacteria bacterium]